LATYLWCLYAIYYNIIVGVGSANSQDFVARFIIVPGSQPGTVRLAPKPEVVRELPPWLRAIVDFLPNLARRDFIVWLAAIYAVLDVPHLSFATHVIGGVISGYVVGAAYVHLRAIRRKAMREGILVRR
jgi:hypothetical protein